MRRTTHYKVKLPSVRSSAKQSPRIWRVINNLKMNSNVGLFGFTIVELLISVAIASILATVLLTISLTFFGNTARSQATAQMAVDSHFMLRAIVEDLRLSDSVATTNTLNDANAPTGGWATSDPNNILILNRPATTTTNTIIYDDSTGNPYNNQFIYFVSNRTLYKRLLKNTAAPGNSVVTTCPPPEVTSSCPADREYSKNIDDLTLTFYDASNNTTNNLPSARTVRVELLVSRKIFGKTVNFNNSILTKLRN